MIKQYLWNKNEIRIFFELKKASTDKKTERIASLSLDAL